MTSKTLLLTVLALSLAFSVAESTKAAADAVFDGVWTGTVTLTTTSNSPDDQKIKIPPRETHIVIANGATSLAIAGGMCSGRYQQFHREGNKLLLTAGDCRITLTLSSDGKTLTENGTCSMAKSGVHWYGSGRNRVIAWLPLSMSATLHRTSLP